MRGRDARCDQSGLARPWKRDPADSSSQEHAQVVGSGPDTVEATAVANLVNMMNVMDVMDVMDVFDVGDGGENGVHW